MVSTVVAQYVMMVQMAGLMKKMMKTGKVVKSVGIKARILMIMMIWIVVSQEPVLLGSIIQILLA